MEQDTSGSRRHENAYGGSDRGSDHKLRPRPIAHIRARTFSGARHRRRSHSDRHRTDDRSPRSRVESIQKTACAGLVLQGYKNDIQDGTAKHSHAVNIYILYTWPESDIKRLFRPGSHSSRSLLQMADVLFHTARSASDMYGSGHKLQLRSA